MLEIKVENTRIIGIVQNTSKQNVHSADLAIELTNLAGSQVGAVNATVENIPAAGRREFQINIKQRDAAFALVRDIVTH